MLSQLSYGPREQQNNHSEIEAATPRRSAWSDRLSHWPHEAPIAGMRQTICDDQRHRIRQWAHEESNFGPRRYQRRALTN